MKQYFIRLGMFAVLLGTFVTTNAQMKIVPADKVVQGERGYFYYLPETKFYLDVTVHKISIRAGEYARYSEKLLGTPAPTSDETQWAITNVVVQAVSEANPQELYHIVPIHPTATLPPLALTQQGFLQSINSKAEAKPFVSLLPQLPATVVLQEYPTGAEKLLGEEYLLAGSANKMAEIAAKAIFATRESKQDLLTGLFEQMPKDGEALKFLSAKLEEQEQLLMSLFTGKKRVEELSYRIPIPVEKGERSEILFRFSSQLGIVDADDLGGAPFYVNTNLKTPPTPQPKVWTEKELRELRNPNSPLHLQGILYNVPSRLTLSFTWKGQQLREGTYNATQGGYQGSLAIDEFTRSASPSLGIQFDPATGSILRRE